MDTTSLGIHIPDAEPFSLIPQLRKEAQDIDALLSSITAALLAAGSNNFLAKWSNSKATGFWTLNTNPADGDVLLANGAAFTFKNSPSGAYQIQRHASSASTSAANAATKLNASTDPLVIGATYSHPTSGQIGVSFDAAGVAGNAYTLGFTSSHISVSGATLTGGIDLHLQASIVQDDGSTSTVTGDLEVSGSVTSRDLNVNDPDGGSLQVNEAGLTVPRQPTSARQILDDGGQVNYDTITHRMIALENGEYKTITDGPYHGVNISGTGDFILPTTEANRVIVLEGALTGNRNVYFNGMGSEGLSMALVVNHTTGAHAVHLLRDDSLVNTILPAGYAVMVAVNDIDFLVGISFDPNRSLQVDLANGWKTGSYGMDDAGEMSASFVLTDVLRFSTLPPVFANNAAAITGGLSAGDPYRTGANPDVLCIVH